MVSDNIKKNLLDLEYNKNLQYFNSIIILIFTYIIGLIIAFLTNQIDYNNSLQLLFVSFISTCFFVSSVMLIFLFRNKLEYIVIRIKQLNI